MPYSQISFLIAGIALSLFSQISHLEAQSNAPDLPLAQEVFSLLYPDGVYDADCTCVRWRPTGQETSDWQAFFGDFLEVGDDVQIILKGIYPFIQHGVPKNFIVTEAMPVKPGYDCHACAPVLGGAILAQTGQHWVLEAHTRAIIAWGAFGVGSAYQFIEIGPEAYGVLFDAWAGNQGCFDQTFLLIAPLAKTLDVIGRFEGGRARSDCIVPDADIEAQWAVLAQPDTAYFPITMTKRTRHEGRLLHERIETYQFSDGVYRLTSSQITRQIETHEMEPSAIAATPVTLMPTATPFTTEAGQPEAPAQPAWMLVDTSSAAYTVLMSLPEDLPEDELATIKARVTKQTNVQFIPWDEFRTSAQNAIAGRIIKNDYPDIDLFTGIIEILTIYARTPLGVTWNGGIAMTAIDYQYADKMYLTYQTNSEEYERVRKKDPKADPVNPHNHFKALLKSEK